jgi:hypothetical protein
MSRMLSAGKLTAMTLVLGLSTHVASARAETPQVNQQAAANVTNFTPDRSASASPAAQHPLTPVISYARREQKFLGETVRDFSCRLVKRERINGFLQEMHFIDMEVREGVYEDGRVVQPLSIYLHFLAPKTVVDRNVIYVEGKNDGKMLIRNGGKHFEYVVAQIDPNSDAARDETLVPLTDIGFDRLLNHMINVLEKHREADPAGSNTKAERIAGAKINNRSCTVIRITHPQRMTGLEFHIANVFVDDALHAPVRVDYSSWPKITGNPAPLIAEYTYTDLKLNAGLSDEAFNPARLRRSGD